MVNSESRDEDKDEDKFYVETLVQGEKSWCREFLLFSYEERDTGGSFIGNRSLIKRLKIRV